MNLETSRQLPVSPQPPSLAKLYREFGERWEIEQIPRGTQWIAVQREPGGEDVRIVTGHDVDALRFRMRNAERD
jgi:hypothetical protein